MAEDNDSKKQGFGTKAVHAGEVHDPSGSHINPIHQTSTFVFENSEAIESWGRGESEAYIYTRGNNPTMEVLAKKISALEGYGMDNADEVSAILFGSGMAAINAALLSICQTGDHIITQQVLYGSTDHLLSADFSKIDISHSRVPRLEPAGLEAELAKHPNTKAVYLESPANPTMTIIDIAQTVEIAHAHGAKVVVDNTFASPALQRPLSFGADAVVHSTTKYINGHGTVIGGVVVSADRQWIEEGPWMKQRYLGAAVPSPFDCWLTNIGLKTLSIRMRQHCANARAVAEFLDAHPKVKMTFWPGLESHQGHEVAARQMDDFGAMISIEIGSYEGAGQFMDGLRMCGLGVSLGNVDTLVQHPASMTHRLVSDEDKAKSGITPGMVRLSIGIEEATDIIADLERGLNNIS